MDLTAYRVVQEALTNARRHAPGARTTVLLDWAGDGLGVEVRNSGRARVDGSTRGTGHGLLGMRERVVLLGGDFRADSRTTGGFRVHARFPVPGGPP